MSYRTWTLPLVLFSFVALPLSARGAIVVDVTGVGDSEFADFSNILVVHVDEDPTGTGTIDPFLRIHHKDSEQGYNTDYRNQGQGGPSLNLLDANTDPNFTDSITLGDIPEIMIDTNDDGVVDTAYREFRLDLGEPGTDDADSGVINFTSLQFFLSTSSTEHIVGDTWNNTLGGATLVYNLDAGAGGDIDFHLRDLTSGNGALDYFVYVKSSIFGSDPSQYVYLYSAFGSPPPTADGTFEEWSVAAQAPPPPGEGAVPEPVSLAIWGLGAGLALVGVRFRRKSTAA